jgi:microcystin-dependent protein
MAINYPASLDTFTNPVATDPMNAATVPHATQHANLNDAVEALEAKVGADSSAVSSSHDYKLARLSTPAGMLAFTIASSAPTGWVFHNQTITNADSTYPALWAVAPAGWKSGTSLVIPNLANAGLMQHGVTSLGATGGANSRTIAEANLPAHTHTGTTASNGAHTHSITLVGTTDGLHYHQDASGRIAQAGESFIPGSVGTTASNGAHTHTFTTGSTGGGTALDTTPLHLGVNVMIKAH